MVTLEELEAKKGGGGGRYGKTRSMLIIICNEASNEGAGNTQISLPLTGNTTSMNRGACKIF